MVHIVHAPLAGAPILFYLLVTLLDTHLTTACVTLYLHRSQTHGAVTFHPVLAHVMRGWLWLRTAMPTKEWVAVHRCHHAHVDSEGDPHSPIVFGIWRVVLLGTQLYHTAAHNQAICEQYGKGTPADWVERRLYQPLSLLGPGVTLLSNVLIFGAAGQQPPPHSEFTTVRDGARRDRSRLLLSAAAGLAAPGHRAPTANGKRLMRLGSK